MTTEVERDEEERASGAAESEIVPQDPDPAAGEGVDAGTADTAQDADELGRLLEDARSKADAHWDQLMRLQAEMENLRKRHARELDSARKFAVEPFVGDLLGVWDSLELGQQAAGEAGNDIARVREGVELTLKQFVGAMNKHGVEQIDPEGEPFDPERHQALSVVARDDLAPNTVAVVVQKGYLLNGRLVRPALVMVSQAASAE
jgi:molecular chaperone GrpE